MTTRGEKIKKFFEIKLSDLIVIAFAAATWYAAFNIGSSEEKQNKEIDILKRDYLRVSGDSTSQYINDSLDWVLTVYKIATIGASMKNWTTRKEPAVPMLPQLRIAISDTIAQLVSLFEVVLHNNKYFNSHYYLQKSAHQYAGFLELSNFKLVNGDGSYEAISWSIGKSMGAWNKYIYNFPPESQARFEGFMNDLRVLLINPAAGH
jgi:hypothetical protein